MSWLTQKIDGRLNAAAACLAAMSASAWFAAPAHAQDAREATAEVATDPQPISEADSDTDQETQPESEVETEPEAQTPGVSASQLAFELESTGRIKAELDALLSADGRRSKLGGEAVISKLSNLVTRCEVIANSMMSDQARGMLLNSQARAIAVLAQIETNEGSNDARAKRLSQLRLTAELIRGVRVDGADASADYWLLLADLADTSNSAASAAARQALAQRLLGGYLEEYAELAVANEFVVDVRLSLARLMDERGDQAGVAEQLDAIGKLDKGSPRQAEVDYLTSQAQRIGQAVQIEGVATNLQMWRLSDQADHIVLVHVYSDAVAPSVEMIGQIRGLIAKRALGGFRIVSLRVGEPIAGTAAAPWPTLPVGLERGGVLDQLGIDALPTLMWIDQAGRLASIGHTLAVLDELPQADAVTPDSDPADAGDNDEPEANQRNSQPDSAEAEAPLDETED